MIRRIRGHLVDLIEESVLIEVSGLTYQVFVPDFIWHSLDGRPTGSEVELCTYHYLATDPAKSVPVLLGFENDIQREFFEMLTEVPRIGPRAALRAFAVPVGIIAKAIELQDQKLLKSLPGVGPQKAKDIISTLAGKLGRFVDVSDLERGGAPPERALENFEAEALEILTQLGLNRADTVQAIQKIREEDPEITSPDEIVRRVFRSR